MQHLHLNRNTPDQINSSIAMLNRLTSKFKYNFLRFKVPDRTQSRIDQILAYHSVDDGFLKKLKNIYAIDLSECHKITDEGLKALVGACITYDLDVIRENTQLIPHTILDNLSRYSRYMFFVKPPDFFCSPVI